MIGSFGFPAIETVEKIAIPTITGNPARIKTLSFVIPYFLSSLTTLKFKPDSMPTSVSLFIDLFPILPSQIRRELQPLDFR